MLKTLKVRGFKSNILDAVQALSRFATSRTLSDALAEPIRGYPVEAFSFPAVGLAELLSGSPRKFDLEADLQVGQDPFTYRVSVETGPLFDDSEISKANILLRGFLDEPLQGAH